MRYISLLIIYLLLSACTTMVNIDYDKNVNFKLFNSYSVQSKPVRIASDTRVDSPFMRQRIVRAIESSLAEKGFDKTGKQANLTVKYYLDVQKDFETEDSGMSIGFGTSSGHSAVGFGFTVPIGEVNSIDKLILTIDMFSPDTNKLIWRGSIATRLGNGSTPDTNTQMVNELVTEIFKNFPPK